LARVRAGKTTGQVDVSIGGIRRSLCEKSQLSCPGAFLPPGGTSPVAETCSFLTRSAVLAGVCTGQLRNKPAPQGFRLWLKPPTLTTPLRLPRPTLKFLELVLVGKHRRVSACYLKWLARSSCNEITTAVLPSLNVPMGRGDLTGRVAAAVHCKRLGVILGHPDTGSSSMGGVALAGWLDFTNLVSLLLETRIKSPIRGSRPESPRHGGLLAASVLRPSLSRRV